ncbi:MAG TPA: PQQ-dependent sugar dehydrogenase [Dehalococcoidia bacterium]|nr:PQQ-dependent sugar dehydrogenase [Dehalococcoidia bacterium]
MRLGRWLALFAFGAAAALSLGATCLKSTPVTDLAAPLTSMAFAPDGRIFVAEKHGAIRIVREGEVTTFATFDVSSLNERGLLGMALDPHFENSPYVYAYYTYPGGVTPGSLYSGANGRIVRIRANGDAPDASGERVLLELGPVSLNHVGGALHFGPDGMLYVGLGEGARRFPGDAPDVLKRRQGYILRINRDGSIPDDNPFAATATGVYRAVYAYGLRNPFTFAFAPDGRMFVNDVGQDDYEEINEVFAGGDYGWSACEGPCGADGVIDPVYSYTHDEGQAITGGVFFNGGYYFADFLGNWIRRLDLATGNVDTVLVAADNPVDLDVYDGSLYYLGLRGKIYRLE